MFGSGIDKLGCLLDAADSFGIVEKRGSWYSKGDQRFAQGRRPAIEFLRTNMKIVHELEAEVRQIVSRRLAEGMIIPDQRESEVIPDDEVEPDDNGSDSEQTFDFQ
jgi:recombination protein RecA